METYEKTKYYPKVIFSVFWDTYVSYRQLMKRFLLFGNLKDQKTLVIHVCRNVFYFSNIEYFAVILVFFYVRSSKTLKILVLGNVMLFLHKGFFYTCALVFWYVRSWKTLKRRFWYSFFIYFFFYSYIEYFSSFLVFWLLTCTIALKRYVFCNVVSFSTIGGFTCISAFWYLIMWKTLKIRVFFFW